MSYDKYKTDNTLRAAFDAAYAAPEVAKNIFARLPKRLTIVVTATAIMLIGLVIVTSNTLAKLEEGKQPPVINRLVAPYDLSNRYLPAVDTSLVAPRPIPVIDTQWFIEERDFQMSRSPDTVTWESVMEIVRPEVNDDFFLILPVMEGFNRSFVHTTRVHPAVNCLIENYAQTYVQEFFCEEGPISSFFEAADYLYDLPITEETTSTELLAIPANQSYARVVAAQYDTPTDAKTAIKQIFRDSQENGSIGNFTMLNSQDVNYFYAFQSGWYVFAWSHDRWVFAISTQDFLKLEEIVTNLPF